MMMNGDTMAAPHAWGKETDAMSLRLVTANDYPDRIADRAPAAGIVIGVFSGAMFWLGLAIGWTLWG